MSTAALHQTLFELEVGKVADCIYAGPYWKKHVPERSVDDTIKALYGSEEPDWVITRLADIPKKRNYGAAVFLADIHRDPKATVKAINNAGVEVVFMRAPLLLGNLYMKYTLKDKEFFLRNINGKVVFLPFSVDTNFFSHVKKKRYDVVFLGNSRKVIYPLRAQIMDNLPTFCKENNYKLLTGGRPHGFKGHGYLKKYYNDPILRASCKVGKDYAAAVASGKTFLFDSSMMKYPVKKYFEGMACGTCVMADAPQLADKLRFIPDYNYVEINRKNWAKKLRYYLTHNEEREKIAKNGRTTIIRHHSNEVRAKQFVKYLKGGI